MTFFCALSLIQRVEERLGFLSIDEDAGRLEIQRIAQRELAEERFRPGGHPTTLPNPGVYARNNAVDMAARLPDGSASELSVSALLQSRTVGQTNGSAGGDE